MASSFFSWFGSRAKSEQSDGVAADPERPARPRPAAKVPRIESDPGADPALEPAPGDAGGAGDASVPTGRAESAGPVRIENLPSPEGHVDHEAHEAQDQAAESAVGPDGTDGADGEVAQTLEGQDESTPAEPTGGRPEVTASRTAAVHEAADAWRAEVRELGSVSTLADMSLLGDAVLDLSRAHPSGLASLYAGRRTQLRNIVRDPEELREARRSARVVSAAATELTHRFGIVPTFLAVGVASWALPPGRVMPGLASGDHPHAPLAGQLSFADLHPQAADAQAPERGRSDVRELGTHQPSEANAVLQVPVLLRPVRLTRADHAGPEPDVALQLDPSVEINPVLVDALREHGVTLDVAAIAQESFGGAGFSPRTALRRLREAGEGVLPGFELDERIVVGTFLDPGQVLVDDLAAVRYRMPDSDVLAAVAGDDAARAYLGEAPIPPLVAGDRAPEAERGIGDLGPREQRVLDAVAAGTSLFVDAPVGSHPDRLTAAILADAAASGTRTLYVPASKRIGRAVLDRLTAAGLEDVVLRLEADPGWQSSAAEQLRRSVAAREVDVDHETLALRREELGGVHTRLARYLGHLHVRREPWGVSVAQVMQQLAVLANTTPPPLSSVRLAPDTLEALQGETGQALRATVHRAAQVGAFVVGPEDTPWYGADLPSREDAAIARERAERLATTTLPRLRGQIEKASAETGLTPAGTLAAWAEQLHVLSGVEASLDVFVPQVYERPVDDLVIATAPRAWRRDYEDTMSAARRKELRRVAQDLVRPGHVASDLHGELRKVQQQGLSWQVQAPEGGWPRVPEGLGALRATEREVRADVDALTDILLARETSLFEMPLAELEELMRALAEDTAALRDLPARAGVLAELRAAGLGGFAEDLAARKVPAAQVNAELDQAWWSGVFHEILAAEPALAGYDGPALTGLAERLRELDLAQVAGLAGPVREAVVHRLREAVYADTDTAAALYHSLGSDGGGHLRATFTQWEALTWRLRPVRSIAPMLVPQVLAAGADVDLLVLDHPRQLGMPQIAGALARARQVVVLGDAAAGLTGAAQQLAEVLPPLSLPTDRSDVATDVMGLLAAHGYAETATVLPTPSGRGGVRLDLLDGEGTRGAPAPGGDAVESPPAEVAHVVDLVVAHAHERPHVSLGVVALTERHAAALRDALRERARTDDALHRMLTAQRQENVVAIGAHDAAGLRRDVIILSVGFGKTVHGRVLHQFGPISQEGGRALLLETLGAVRHELIVVSCLAPSQIHADRVQAPGAQLLAALLAGAARGSLLPEGDPMETAPLPLVTDGQGDQLLSDLAERLWAEGLRVERDIVVPGLSAEVASPRLPLVVGVPGEPESLRWVVLTDDAEYVAEPSLRVRDRHHLEALEARGWHTVRAFSASMFLDLHRLARDIAASVRAWWDAGGDGGVAAVPAVPAGEDVAPAGSSGAAGNPGPAGDAGVDAATSVSVGDDAPVQASDAPVPASDAADATSKSDAVGATAEGPAAPAPASDAAPAQGSGAAPAPASDPAPAQSSEGPTASEPTPILRRPDQERPAQQRPNQQRSEQQRPMPRGPRPPVESGRGLVAYTDDELEGMVRWILSDTLPRTDGQVVTELRAHLAITETGTAARAVLAGAVRRGRA